MEGEKIRTSLDASEDHHPSSFMNYRSLNDNSTNDVIHEDVMISYKPAGTPRHDNDDNLQPPSSPNSQNSRRSNNSRRSSRRGGSNRGRGNGRSSGRRGTNRNTEESNNRSSRRGLTGSDPLSTATSVESCEYRGFSTSIFDMFTSTDSERVDCCALTCCGILQSDRDRYLLQGIPPPGLFKRCTVHFLVPFAMFMLAGMVATHVSDRLVNNVLSTMLVLALIFYLWMQCYKGRTKRIGIRKDILYLKHQIQQHNHPEGRGLLTLLNGHAQHRLHYHGSEDEDDGANQDDMPQHYLGQSKRDFGCAHPCCLIGCYADDRKAWSKSTSQAAGSSLLASGVGETDGEDAVDWDESRNVCRCLYASVCSSSSCFSLGCCCRTDANPRSQASLCCGMHVQTCGMCAIAQEAREVENVLLPPSYRRIDYITMQSVTDYYPAIYRAKWKEAVPEPSTVIQLLPGGGQSVLQVGVRAPKSGWCCSCIPPLSRLSWRLLQTFALATVGLLAWSVLGPLYWTVLIKTRNKAHSFSVYDFLIYLATVTQVLILLAAMGWFIHHRQGPKIRCDLSTDAIIKFFFSGFFLSSSLAVFWELLCSQTVSVFVSILLAIFGVDARSDPSDESTSSAIYSSDYTEGNYFKHLRTFILPPSLVDMNKTKDFLEAFGNDHPFIYSIYIFFSAFCLAAMIEELCKYYGYRMVEHPDFFTKVELVEAGKIIMGENDDDEDEHEENEFEDEETPPSRRGRTSRRQDPTPDNAERIPPPDYSRQCQSMQARGAAITLAMVSAAMGFTCCENLVYVFFYSSSSARMELTVLISRSLFPVHPIAAAIQSIGVCQRDIEGVRKLKIGRIILPAVVFHGAYDFFLLWIDFLFRRQGVYAGEDGAEAFDQDSAISVLIAFVVSLVIMGLALIYLYRESNAQRARLAEMDRHSAVETSRLT